MKIYNKTDIVHLVNHLSQGEVIALPTETVFGFAINCTSEVAFQKLMAVKGRENYKPFTLMCSSVEEALNFVDVDNKIISLMNYFSPGPITYILSAKKNIPHWIDFSSGKVGIRIPDDKFILELIKSNKSPLLVPSANKAGEKPCSSYVEIIDKFEGEVSAVVEGNIENGVPSTIILVDDDIILIREGNLKFETIRKYWETL